MVLIGNVEIIGDVALSPMAGVSDSPTRSVARSFGSAFSFSEFVSTEQIILNNQKSWDMFRFEEAERPIYFQIFGSKVSTVVTAGMKIESLKPDVIDLNMGCSVSKVSHKGSGAGLLKNLPMAARMIEGLRKSVSVPITAKMRIGWNADLLNYRETVHVLQESGVQGISVHGRTKEMGYSGSANWDIIGEIKSFAKVPIFGNGDVASYEDALDKKKKYGVDLVLIGRNAIGNPWVFQNSNHSFEIKKWLVTVINHLDNMILFYPPSEYAVLLFRKHLSRYLSVLSTKFPNIKIQKRDLLEINESNQLKTRLHEDLFSYQTCGI